VSEDASKPGNRPALTHLDEQGRAQMVDVSEKDVTSRRAVAVGAIRMSLTALDRILSGQIEKGEVFGTARVAAIMAGKRAGELIPLCHVLPAVSVDVDFEPDRELPGVRVRAAATIAGRTGVEIEALTAASLALLTIYDMVKAVDRGMQIDGVRLVEKSGGRSGDWKSE
jgi:cyclic pyranopterin phosphate synthase